MNIFSSVLIEISIAVGYCVVAGVIGAMLMSFWDRIKKKLRD